MLKNKLEVSMYRYNPEVDKFPYMKTYSISKPSKDIMVLMKPQREDQYLKQINILEINLPEWFSKR